MKKYFKNKRHVIYFIVLLACFIATTTLFIFDAINYSKHQEEYTANGSPLTIAAIIALFVLIAVFIFFVINLIVFFVKNKHQKEDI